MAETRGPQLEHPLSVLHRELGARGGLKLLALLAREVSTGDPFSELGPPWTTRERLSRGQARPAVWLYRALLRQFPDNPQRALQVATAVIAAEGARFVSKGLGTLDGESFSQLAPAAARAQVSRWLDHFFTAAAYVEEVRPDDGHVSFRVSSCALARLVNSAGHPELAGAFCAADNLFFAAQRPAVVLDRPQTIARGDRVCEFNLSLGPSQATE